jgi:ribosome-associated protein
VSPSEVSPYTDDLSSADLATTIARIADAEHGSDILVLQVGEMLAVTECFVIVGASNRRLVRSLVDAIEVQTRALTGRAPVRSEGVREQQWVLIDYGDVVVHVFLNEVREFYEIERLYRDAPIITWAATI